MGKNATILANQLIERSAISLFQKVISSIQWKLSSFAGKQKMIDEYKRRIVSIVESIDNTPQLGEIAYSLLCYKKKKELPTQEDIHWLSEIITVLQKESHNSIVSIMNYYILLEFLHAIPQHNYNLKELVEKACNQYTQQYAEALLISTEELKDLLTTVSLYYPGMEADYILQSVCGIIKLAVRLTELSKKDEVWEEELRKELCQLHSLNIHICLLLEDSELRHFLEESETKIPQDVVTVIIQQLTLEEVYRKHGGESAFFSKVNAMLPLIQRSVYYGKQSPIFTLYNYVEYCKGEYSCLFTLPLHYFIEILSLLPALNEAQSFIDVSHALAMANDIAIIMSASITISSSVTAKQKELLVKYASMTKEELDLYKSQTLEEESNTNTFISTFCTPTISYPEYTVIFSFIESILYKDTSLYRTVPTPSEYIEFLTTCEVHKEYIHILSLLLHVIKEKGIVEVYSLEEHNTFIQKIVKECRYLLQVELPIFYAIITDIIKKHHTLQDISMILSYCSAVIDIAKQERLHTGTAMMQKESCVHEEHATTLCEPSTSNLQSTSYDIYSRQIQ